MPIRTTETWIKITTPPTIIPNKFRQRQPLRTNSFHTTMYQKPIVATEALTETSTAATLLANKIRHRQLFRTKNFPWLTNNGTLIGKS